MIDIYILYVIYNIYISFLDFYINKGGVYPGGGGGEAPGGKRKMRAKAHEMK